jgi:transposase
LRESRKYRRFSAQQKTELALASLRGPRTVAEICREHEMSEPRLRKWREQFPAAGSVRPSGKAERTELYELRARCSGSSARRWSLRSRGNS